MDIESSTQANERGVCGRWWGYLKSLPEKSKSKFLNVASNIKKTAQADPRRVIHSLKMGMALTLVSLLYYIRSLYDEFGVAGIWAVLTVVVVFEFTVGATLSKGMNRGFATLLAGALGVGGQHLATCSGESGKPFVLGTLVFILAAGSTFSRFFPKIKAKYDYGVLIFILTFSLVAVSGQRVENIFELAYQRLLTILIGGATCMLISLFVFPVWAGKDLHNLIASNLEKLANFLQGFECVYFECSEGKENPDKSVLQGYRSVLNSKASEESLANFAWWEPGHGRFRLCHPWKQYVKIGALARECACKIESLDRYLNPEIQVSLEFKGSVQESCMKLCSEASKALKALSSSIQTMTDPCDAKPHLENSKDAIRDLKIALETTSLEDEELITIIPVATVASILIEITKCVEKIHDSVSELSHLAHFRTIKPDFSVSAEKPHLLHRGIIKPVGETGGAGHVEITIEEPKEAQPTACK
ncbi:aluminum-activated malate transporter 8-like [Neltuma alba]|uniref:aluminum-activated malate transporter 8-like n=1 Tax=Neltuma alba TaxID=207710 RepID=UPI0010A351E2|nr:aluminum-activated malate transporter 8-like [Prosopis alba]